MRTTVRIDLTHLQRHLQSIATSKGKLSSRVTVLSRMYFRPDTVSGLARALDADWLSPDMALIWGQLLQCYTSNCLLEEWNSRQFGFIIKMLLHVKNNEGTNPSGDRTGKLNSVSGGDCDVKPLSNMGGTSLNPWTRTNTLCFSDRSRAFTFIRDTQSRRSVFITECSPILDSLFHSAVSGNKISSRIRTSDIRLLRKLLIIC